MTEQQKKRCDLLYSLHMTFNGKEYIGSSKFNSDFNVHWTEITCDTDEEFKNKIDKLEKTLYKRIDTKLNALYQKHHISAFDDIVKHNAGITKALREALLMDVYDLDDI